MNKFTLSVFTPDGERFRGEVVSVIAPGVDGLFGIWAHHAAMLAALGIGELTYRLPDGTEKHVAIAGGLLEVGNNTVTLLADVAEFSDQIDLERAKKALERAQQRLQNPDKFTDVDRARAALMRALNRIKVHGKQ